MYENTYNLRKFSPWPRGTLNWLSSIVRGRKNVWSLIYLAKKGLKTFFKKLSFTIIKLELLLLFLTIIGLPKMVFEKFFIPKCQGTECQGRKKIVITKQSSNLVFLKKSSNNLVKTNHYMQRKVYLNLKKKLCLKWFVVLVREKIGKSVRGRNFFGS